MLTFGKIKWPANLFYILLIDKGAKTWYNKVSNEGRKEKMNVFIWLDDERNMPAPPFDWCYRIHAKTYLEALHYLQYYCKTEPHCVYIDFDHDLGEGKTGYDVAKWIVENELDVRYRVHSMNPVGRANIEQLMEHYGYRRF